MSNRIEPALEITVSVKKGGKVISEDKEVIDHGKQHHNDKA